MGKLSPKGLWATGTYSPEVEHVEQDGNFHQVEPSADVVIPEHKQTLAQLQRRPFEEVGLPVAPQDLPQRRGVDLQGVLVDQLAQQDSVLRLEEDKNVLGSDSLSQDQRWNEPRLGLKGPGQI